LFNFFKFKFTIGNETCLIYYLFDYSFDIFFSDFALIFFHNCYYLWDVLLLYDLFF